MPADLPDVAIIIVTYQSREEIAACLDSVIGQTAPFTSQVVVVDNASPDGTAAFVRERWPEVQVVDAGGNLGFSRANNLGAASSRSEFLLLLNPDTVAPPGALATLVQTLAAAPDAAIAGPRLVDAERGPEVSFGPRLTPWGELRQKLLLWLYERRVGAAVRYVERRSREAGDRDWVSGACLLVRRRDFDAVGGFDGRFFMYMEDVDLCTSIRARGRRVLFVPQAEVLHLRGRSASRNPDTERLRRLSQLAYYEKHLPRWTGALRWYLRLTGRGAYA